VVWSSQSIDVVVSKSWCGRLKVVVWSSQSIDVVVSKLWSGRLKVVVWSSQSLDVVIKAGYASPAILTLYQNCLVLVIFVLTPRTDYAKQIE